MQLTSNETMFLNMIKPVCIKRSVEEKIAPSVMAALAIDISNWGTNPLFQYTRNVYMLPVGENWYGKCFSKNTKKIYDSVEKCTEIGSSLYRVYGSHQDSVNDFISTLMSSRRSKNGPLRYECLVRCTDYKESTNRLVRAGFMEAYLNRKEDPWYAGRLQTIIEKYELFVWDEELKKSIQEEDNRMSKNRRHIHVNRPLVDNANQVVETATDEIVEEEAVETAEEEVTYEAVPIIEDHIYRVRLDWDRPDTQIFASPNYTDCKEEAMKHEGYKIYIDDDGELFEDPWVDFYKKKEETAPVTDGMKKVVHPIPGKIVILDNTPVFRKAIDRQPYCILSGTFYFYDNTVVNNRAKITRVKNNSNPKDPTLILGYINI